MPENTDFLTSRYLERARILKELEATLREQFDGTPVFEKGQFLAGLERKLAQLGRILSEASDAASTSSEYIDGLRDEGLKGRIKKLLQNPDNREIVRVCMGFSTPRLAVELGIEPQHAREVYNNML